MSDPTGATALSLYVPGFRENLNNLPQQMEARLVGAVDADLAYATPGELFNADDIGITDPQPVLARVPRTPDKFVEELRRVGFFNPFNDTAWLDNEDMARQLEDPTNKVMMALMAGMKRSRDDRIIAAAAAPVATGKNGQGVPAVLPATQVIAANDRGLVHQSEQVPAGQNDFGLSIGKLLKAQQLLDASELEGERYLAWSSGAKAQLLQTTPATNDQFASVKALVSGELTEFLGFKFIRTERLPTVASANVPGTLNRRCFAWVKPAIIYNSRQIITARVTQRADFSYRWQAYYEFDHGACRRYDNGVVEIDCNGA